MTYTGEWRVQVVVQCTPYSVQYDIVAGFATNYEYSYWTIVVLGTVSQNSIQYRSSANVLLEYRILYHETVDSTAVLRVHGKRVLAYLY